MFEESKHFSSGVFEVQESSWKFKEEVAETAISLFKRDGYNNVTVNDICKACAISRSVFYSSFNAKRRILEYMEEKPQHNDDKNCAKAGIIDTEEPPDLLSRIATDLVCHELYVWCSQKGNFSLRARARQYAEVAYHVKPEYRMPAEQRDAL